jgi:hypothetical protein
LAAPVLTKIVTARFEPCEYANIQRLASDRNMSVSGLIRARLFDLRLPPQRTPRMDAEAVRELHRIGVSLNQVVHTFNRWSTTPSGERDAAWDGWKELTVTLHQLVHDLAGLIR